MNTISSIQLILLSDGRKVLRCYNEDKDIFEKICVARDVSEIEEDKLFRADDRLYYNYRGKLRFIGQAGDAAPVLTSAESGVLLYALAVKNELLPFRYAFFRGPLACRQKTTIDLIQSYSLNGRQVTAVTPDGKELTYHISRRADEWGYPEYDFLDVR